MMDTKQYLANVARFAAQAVARTAPFVPENKRNWSPMGAARTTTDMVQECAEALEIATKFMQTSQFARPDAQARAELLKKNPPKLEELFPRLQKAADEYAQALEKFPAERLMEMVPSPFGGEPRPLLMQLSMPVFNMMYHYGQINYIQTMLGDTEMH
ncbi:DinB family protein [Candidatus Acetothermia bacterium]|jgi:hypothetical protein|nr:DinB family protein [Candidatus Acetothermia bacterium]MCI2432326.1 DinB family protein [Candidatus Acetothermia bacterium]MCI2437315.1 DinB family protein [Candidatus Acetothermia bacterium]